MLAFQQQQTDPYYKVDNKQPQLFLLEVGQRTCQAGQKQPGDPGRQAVTESNRLRIEEQVRQGQRPILGDLLAHVGDKPGDFARPRESEHAEGKKRPEQAGPSHEGKWTAEGEWGPPNAPAGFSDDQGQGQAMTNDETSSSSALCSLLGVMPQMMFGSR